MFIHPRRWVRSWSLLGWKKKTFKTQFWVVIGPHIWDGEHDNDREHHPMTIFCFARTPLNKSSSLRERVFYETNYFHRRRVHFELCVGVSRCLSARGLFWTIHDAQFIPPICDSELWILSNQKAQLCAMFNKFESEVVRMLLFSAPQKWSRMGLSVYGSISNFPVINMISTWNNVEIRVERKMRPKTSYIATADIVWNLKSELSTFSTKKISENHMRTL